MAKSPVFFLTLLLGAGSCGGTSDSASESELDPTSETDDSSDLDGDGTTECSPDADADGDGLDDCTEEELGTDPELADSDDDGFTDSQEVDCVSNPLDVDEFCYACGWEHNDPGNLESTGADEGDVMDNFSLVDQCGEMVDMWDFHGEYFVLFQTAAW